MRQRLNLGRRLLAGASIGVIESKRTRFSTPVWFAVLTVSHPWAQQVCTLCGDRPGGWVGTVLVMQAWPASHIWIHALRILSTP